MKLSDIKQIITTLDNFSFQDIKSWMYTEEGRRAEVDQLNKGKKELIDSLRDKGVAPTLTNHHLKDITIGEELTDVKEWKDPQGDYLYMYMEGDVIQHNGVLWASLIDLNNYEPSEENVYVWRNIQEDKKAVEAEEAPEPEYEEWAPNKTYAAKKILSYNGRNYVVVQRHISASNKTPDEIKGLYALI